MSLQDILSRIPHPDRTAAEEARRRWDSLAKPLGSLGLLEDMVCQMTALGGNPQPDISRRAVLVLCADNGVVAQGVSQTGSQVTAAVARQLVLGRTSVCRMAQTVSCQVIPVDMGMETAVPGTVDRRVAAGTADFTLGPAMTRAQAEKAIEMGVDLVREARDRGYGLLCAGEMGIGNTTTAAALTAVLLGRGPAEVTGRGAGLSQEGLGRKVEAITEGIRRNRPDPGDPVDVLSKVGGLDLAGLCGVYLGGALYRVPVLMDGFPSAAAALCALRLCPQAAGAVLCSHVSAEPGSRLLLEAMGKKPLLTAGLRLGEGTGAVAAIPLLDMALAVYGGAYTFREGGIAPYQPL